MQNSLSRREAVKRMAAGAALALPILPFESLSAFASSDENRDRLAAWSRAVRFRMAKKELQSTGARAIAVGELAVGTPYEAFTLEAYLKAGGNPLAREPIALSLTRFDCVTLVESCLAIARGAVNGVPSWDRFSKEVERMRYRGGRRSGYSSRLHYFSEWISDGESRGLLRDLGEELGGVRDTRPLRFMTEHRSSYPALANDSVFREIGEIERRLDARPRWMIPSGNVAAIQSQLRSGDVIAFATSIAGLDVSHAAFAYRDSAGTVRVLHAPLSGGSVEITRSTLHEYVAAIRRGTGLLVARPL